MENIMAIQEKKVKSLVIYNFPLLPMQSGPLLMDG